jgi:hypothetical protein
MNIAAWSNSTKPWAEAGNSKIIGQSQETVYRWRRERDSNPRYGFPHSGFQDRLFQPLTHPSAASARNTDNSLHSASRETSLYHLLNHNASTARYILISRYFGNSNLKLLSDILALTCPGFEPPQFLHLRLRGFFWDEARNHVYKDRPLRNLE